MTDPVRDAPASTSSRALPWIARLFWVGVGLALLLVATEGGLWVASRVLADPEADDPGDAEFTILAVGDSFTYGVAGTAFPKQLGRMLNERAGYRRFRVVNVALPGANSTYITDELPKQLETYQPDVVLVTTGENNSWNAVRIEQGAPWYKQVKFALQRTRVYKLVDAAWAGWANPNFHQGSPTLLQAQAAANYLSDFNDTVGDEYREAQKARPKAAPLTDDQRRRLEQAFNLEDELKYDEAMEIFASLTQEAPTNLEPYVGLLECLSRLEFYDEAANVMHQALYETPGLVPDPAAFYELGINLDFAGRHDEAVRAWTDGLKLFPRSRATMYVLGNSYWKRGQSVWRALEVVDEVPEVVDNPVYRYLVHLSHMTEGYATGEVRELVSATFRADLERIATLVEAAGAKAIFSSYPEHAYAEVEEVARAHGIPYIDFRPIFAKRFDERSDYIGADGFHCNTDGYRVMAEVFGEQVLAVLGARASDARASSDERTDTPR